MVYIIMEDFMMSFFSKVWRVSSFFVFFIFVSILPLQAETNLLMFEKDGCYWCEQWRQEVGKVYDKTKEGKQAPLIVINVANPIPEKYELKSAIFYSPTFVLVQNNKEFARIEGYPGEEFFWASLEQILSELNK